MRTYPESFKASFGYKPADDVTQYQIYQEIFARLPHRNILASTNEGDFVYLNDAMTRIGQLKQAGLTPSQLKANAKADQAWNKVCNETVQKHLGNLKLINKAADELLEDFPPEPRKQ